MVILSSSYSTVKKLTKCFRLRHEFLEDHERPGHPLQMITSQNISIIEQIILADRRLKVKELAVTVMSIISETSVRQVLRDPLGKNKISARSVTRLLSAIRRVECARSFLNMWGRPKSNFGVRSYRR